MKLYLITFIAALCCYSIASAQETASVSRNIRLEFIKGDSIRLGLNEEFNLIEENCSQILRYCHVDLQQRKFTGPFKDVSHDNPQLIITQGAYSAEGLKEGPFIINYLDGTPQARGSFKHDKFEGKWELFYNTGKPLMTFDASGTDIKIIDVWDEKGKKTVDNGNGIYRSDMGFIYWKGKLLNGRPDGKWRSKKTADNSDFTAEVYNLGAFKKGITSFNEYTDGPRMELISPTLFLFVGAERLSFSQFGCGFSKPKTIIHASYSGGMNSFSERIGEALSSYLNTIDLKSYDELLTIEGEITETGNLAKLKAINPFNINISQSLINKLRTLPRLKPATIDGKPVAEGFSITMTFQNGMYRFSYQFLPIKQ
ncbi:hypothetical protein ACFQZI_03665 [Mucilaginibacter lutimaris]|uniref:MORN repeat variant n=1 Tax=Mucilaginibacter lutimaris TaxID=931629 RepID=A0ABW2ZCE5_9SPHI